MSPLKRMSALGMYVCMYVYIGIMSHDLYYAVAKHSQNDYVPLLQNKVLHTNTISL